jgi:hypothetical protein
MGITTPVTQIVLPQPRYLRQRQPPRPNHLSRLNRRLRAHQAHLNLISRAGSRQVRGARVGHGAAAYAMARGGVKPRHFRGRTFSKSDSKRDGCHCHYGKVNPKALTFTSEAPKLRKNVTLLPAGNTIPYLGELETMMHLRPSMLPSDLKKKDWEGTEILVIGTPQPRGRQIRFYIILTSLGVIGGIPG